MNMNAFDPSAHPHRRFNPLTNGYILVSSSHRTKRPWLGQLEVPQSTQLPQYDEACYLCPGNSRTSGQQNPIYENTYTFENDFAAILHAPAPEAPIPSHPLLTLEPVHGACDVLVFHPRHDLSMARLDPKDIEHIIDGWIRIYKARGAEPGIEYVQIFENKGSIMGCSNPHPHGQAWSLSAIPSIPAQELRLLTQYAHSTVQSSDGPKGPGGLPCLLCDYAHTEMKIARDEGRVVVSNAHWVAIVPWWATWPFEILLLPYRRHVPAIDGVDAEEKRTFADILSCITRRYDNLFSCSFGYSMGIHQRPLPALRDQDQTEDQDSVAHLHLHFEPPLLRNATVKKFLVGYEMLAEPQRDLTPEEAAARLRGCSEVHYLDR